MTRQNWLNLKLALSLDAWVAGFYLTFLVVLGGCVTKEVRLVDMTPPNAFQGEQAEDQLLDIGIAIFDPNVPEDYDEQIEFAIQPEIRRAEANYMPYFAKNLLQSTGNWGAVRVIPRPTNAVDVVLTGKILHSDGEQMTLEVSATDATGRHWLTNEYAALASKYAYEDTIPSDVDPFQAVYKNLANDLLAFRATLSEAEIIEIRRIAEMRFAQNFAPDAFGEHLTQDADSRYVLKRLPADSDPMLSRVRKVREREYLFIDTLDEYYAGFHQNMYSTYNTWRKSSYAEAIAYRRLRAEAKTRIIGGTMAIVGGIGAIYGSDNAYVDSSGVVSVMSGALTVRSAIAKRDEAEMHANSLQEIGLATEAELVPYTLELENQSVRLQGTVDEQYGELRRILRKVFYEDLGLEAPAVEPTEPTEPTPPAEVTEPVESIPSDAKVSVNSGL